MLWIIDRELSTVSRLLLQKQECLVIVTGDHGMKDSGGHGGITDAEVTVPLVSVGRPCATLPG